MRNIVNIMMLLASVTFFWACETDNDHPIALTPPDTFVLNVPPYASIVTDLQKSTTLALTCSQPEYGFTAATTYSVQVSLNNTWNAATDTTSATYEELAALFTTAQLNPNAIDLDKTIIKLSGWTAAEEVPDKPMDVYIRLKAVVSTLMPAAYSNSVKITVLPFYTADALPATYYLIGACIGDGTWTNTQAAIGVSLIPLSLMENQEYDKVNGTGVFVYTGYFPAGQGFKLVGVPGFWPEQWGQNADGTFAHNDGGSSDITVAADGWYTVTLNTVTNELNIAAASANPSDFSAMQLVGTFEGWGANPIQMTNAGGTHSHVWYADVTFDADAKTSGDSPEGCKFRTDDAWTNNWGGDNFPYSLASTPGNNIPYKAGTYRVVFNDLDQCYFFFAK
ncbi:MAG: SusF/SusE family outer membrane protein [Candidatus Azobacteroides sp.]|nr:SusF/SusE family outer membrane protein [Candidatus Azobacteroides sp.]